MGKLLDVIGISKTFAANKVLDEVCFSVEPGEVHALVGENGAGKSTLMNIISGVIPRDSGTVIFESKEVDFVTPRDAMKAGIGFLHQELALCPHLSVAENMFMWNMPQNAFGAIQTKELYRKTEEALGQFHIDFKVWERVSRLSVAQQQVVEIAKAMSMEAHLLVLDEPTSSLTARESEYMFELVDRLRKQGIGIVYISHRMSEIFNLCDRVTVLRDGKTIMTKKIKEVTPTEVVTSMVGRQISAFYPPKSSKIYDDELVRVEKLTASRFKNISFSLKKGEILGFSGLVGAGRSEVMRALCGLDSYESGDLWYRNKKVVNKSYKESIKRGICYLTEDRKKNGLFLKLSVTMNISSVIIDLLTSWSIIQRDKEKTLAKEQIKTMGIKATNDDLKVRRLSGGNQQKVMISKWLAAKPSVLIMDEPTRGIDVGAKSEIHFMLRRLCESGIGVIIISSEMPEVIGLCDRIIVMHEGGITGVVSGDDINEKNLIMLASNQSVQGKVA